VCVVVGGDRHAFDCPLFGGARTPNFGGQPLLALSTRCTQPILDSDTLRDNMDLQFPERLGRCLVSDGRYNDAERPYTQMMEMRKRVWGGASIHPEERQQPGTSLQYQGKYEEAEMINRRLKLPAAELAYRWVAFDSPLDPECGDATVFDASKLSQVKETLA
jgi:hypothetical protein